MKLRFPTLSAILWLALAGVPLWARLGETVEECDARYGIPRTVDKEKDGVPTRTYQYGDFLVQVAFLDGRSACEEFKKNNKTLLTAEEAQRILDVNKQGADWAFRDDFDAATPESWTRVDGLARAWTIGNPKTMVVVTKDYADRKRGEADDARKKKQDDEEKQLQGL